ncbi:MAG: hypothetical protein WA949_11230 [Phormidesmis sp.]
MIAFILCAVAGFLGDVLYQGPLNNQLDIPMQTGSRNHNPVSSSISQSVDSRPADRSANYRKENVRKNVLSGVVALASATTLIQFSSESAAANPQLNSYRAVLSQQSPSDFSSQISPAVAVNQAQAIAPQIHQSEQVAFSNSATSTTSSSKPQAAVIAENHDDQWSLAYSTQANTAQADSAVQTVVAQVAQEATRAKACADDICRRLMYIRSQLPSAAQKVQRLEKQLDDFSAQHGQGDMSAYKTVLSDRIAEISSQKQQLAIELDQTRLQTKRLRSRLSVANIEPDIAERVLASDTIYQVLWGQLAAIEENIQKEYSQVNVDGTALNQLYAEYQALLGKTQTAAPEALNRYLLVGGNQIAGITYHTAVVTETLKDLLVQTHQQNTQQLRQDKIAAIETELMSRHQHLSEKIGEYERLQRELHSAKRVLNSYTSERDRILADSPEAALMSTDVAYNPQSLVTAQTLIPLLPDGSIAKTLLGIVIAASLVAAATHRSSEKKAALLGARILEILPTSAHTTSYSALQPQKSQLAMISLADLVRETQLEIANSPEAEMTNAKAPLEDLFSMEERPAQSTSFCIVNDLGEFEISESAARSLDKAVTEIKAADFNQALENLTPESLFTHEVNGRDIEPVRLPVAEIDLFVEKAIEWVLKDLGLEMSVADAATDKVELATEPAVVEPVAA